MSQSGPSAAHPLQSSCLSRTEVLRNLALRRFFALFWRRQGAKSTNLSEATIAAMMAQPGLSVI